MRNYIILNGKNSNEINGLLIQELPPISKPLIRTEVEEIDGRDGDIVTPLGYSAYDKEFTIGLYKDFDVNEVAAYFNSEGTVIFSNEPDKYYYYQITAQIDFERLVRYRTATVTMHCQPFKYSATEQPITEDVSGTVSDEGTNLALENTAEAPFNTLDLKGNTSQQTYAGKNLFNNDTATDAYIQSNGTLAPNPVWRASQLIKVKPNTSYIWHGEVYGAEQVVWAGYNSSRAFISGQYAQVNNVSSLVITTGANTEYLRVGYRSDGMRNMQLELGSSASSFEPYVGGVPAPNPDYPQAVQTVTGENVVKIWGKNLYNYEDAYYVAGDYTVDSEGWITCSLDTAPTGNSDQAYYTHNLPLKNSTQYAVVVEIKSISISGSGYGYLAPFSRWTGNQEGQFTTEQYMYFANLRAGQTYVYKPTTYASFNYDVGLRTYARFTAGQTGTITFRISVLADTSITADTFNYEPYQGQSYEVNLGKNLFDGANANARTGYILNNSGVEVSDNTGGYTRNYSVVKPNTTYTISGLANAGTRRIYYYDGAKNFISRSAGNGSSSWQFTTPANCHFVNVQIYTNRDDAAAMAVWQIELGSSATSYAAYFTPIELCKIGTYQDSIYKSGGKWYVHKETGKRTYTADDITIAASDAYSNVRYAQFPKGTDNKQYGNYTYGGIINFFTHGINMGATPAGGWNSYISDGLIYNSAMQDNYWCSFAKSTVLATMKEKLNGMVAYYVLATPTDTEITNEALITQLDDIYYHSHAYKGRTHITSSAAAGNVPHIIAAEVGEDNESTITNAGNYLSKPKITVYGSGDISLYINDMHVLQITLGDEGYITIDTAQMEAYKDTLDNLKNRLVIGDYSNARLKPGANKIHFTGTVTKYVVENYSRWL